MAPSKYGGDIYYRVNPEKQGHELVFPPSSNHSENHLVIFTASSIDIEKKPFKSLKLTDKDVVGCVGPVESFEAIQVFISDYRDSRKSKKKENNILQFMAEMERFTLLEIKANKIPRSEWESKYSTEVYKALVFITHRVNSKEPESPYTPYVVTSQGTTNVTPPSTNHSANRGGTSTPKNPSAPAKKASAQPAVGSTPRFARPEIDPERQIRERSPGDNITVAQSSTASSTIKNPPKTRGGHSNSAHSAPTPPKTETRSSRETQHQGGPGSTRQDARKLSARLSKNAEVDRKKKLEALPKKRGTGPYGGKGGFVEEPI